MTGQSVAAGASLKCITRRVTTCFASASIGALDLVPAFIVSAPRSGTTWLTQALGAHPEVYATELRAFGQHADFVHDAGAPRARLRITLDRYVDALLSHHLWRPLEPSRELPGAHVRKGIVGDWKMYFTREDATIFHAVAGQTLIQSGYERDDAWTASLPGRLHLKAE